MKIERYTLMVHSTKPAAPALKPDNDGAIMLYDEVAHYLEPQPIDNYAKSGAVVDLWVRHSGGNPWRSVSCFYVKEKDYWRHEGQPDYHPVIHRPPQIEIIGYTRIPEVGGE